MLERFLPTRDAITQSRLLRWLGPRIHDPLLWHVNRRSVARGVAMGVFFGLMIPIAQIPAAAIASLLLRGNLWIAAVSTLVSNPLTYGPLYYFAYRLGAGVIGARTPADLTAEAVEQPMRMIDSLAQAWAWITGIGQPLLLGMLKKPLKHFLNELHSTRGGVAYLKRNSHTTLCLCGNVSSSKGTKVYRLQRKSLIYLLKIAEKKGRKPKQKPEITLSKALRLPSPTQKPATKKTI